MHWTLRFFDPVVSPGLGLIDETREPAPPSGSRNPRHSVGRLSPVRPAGQWAVCPPRAARRHRPRAFAGRPPIGTSPRSAQLRPRDGSLVSEMYQAHVNAMPIAARLLAGALTGTPVVQDGRR